MKIRAYLVVFTCLIAPAQVRGEPGHGFAFQDGDRVVLVGDTLIERDQRYGYLEALVTSQYPDKSLTFRNLGWSGDTVEGVSRTGFDPPETGFETLRQQILAARPTVVIVGYGMADSFAGQAGLPRFAKGLERLLDAIAPSAARVIVLSPIAHENVGRKLPDPAGHNAQLALYVTALEAVAHRRGAFFINLFELLPLRNPGEHLTDNGIHLTELGYRRLAGAIARELAPEASRQPANIELAADGTVGQIHGARVELIERSAAGIRFRLTSDHLPLDFDQSSGLSLAVNGLVKGSFRLDVDHQNVVTRPASQWAQGVLITTGPDWSQSGQLRREINRKNQLFFYRWRPQNHTYLFGFRQHEQGNNAVEIPRFDPLIAEQEKSIARLKKPVAHLYELTRVEGEVAR